MEDLSKPFLCETSANASTSSAIAEGFTDVKGAPAERASTGGWASAVPLVVYEGTERMASFSLSTNMITFLTDVLHLSTATAAVHVSVWSGTSAMLSLLGAFLSDACLGPFRTALYFGSLYIIGFYCLILLASFPSVMPAFCDEISNSCPKATMFQLSIFFVPYYLVACSGGCQKPCLQALGADQFDEKDSKEATQKSWFFSWWNFSMNIGILLSIVFVNIEESVSWGLGFGIPATAATAAFLGCLLTAKRYRYRLRKSSPFTKIARVLVAAFHTRGLADPTHKDHKPVWQDDEEQIQASESSTASQLTLSNQCRFLDRTAAMVAGDNVKETEWRTCNAEEVEEVKSILRLIPIWISTLMYGVIFIESQPFLIKQGNTMDRTIISNLRISAASLTTVRYMSSLVFLPSYNSVIVPLCRRMRGNFQGITMLQRVGIGLLLTILAMVLAALVETKRLNLVQKLGLEDDPSATVPMSIYWFLPQEVLSGLSIVFALVGMQEFFYSEIPVTMKSMGIALYVSSIGLGGYLGGTLIAILNTVSSMNGHTSWFDSNINKGHIDYFYWVLAGLSTVFFGLYVGYARNFPYKGN